MDNECKLINKFLDYCFKNIKDIYWVDECNVSINILDKKYSLIIGSLFMDNNTAISLLVENIEILALKDVPNSEMNLIKYKVSKLVEEYKTHELSLLENFLDNPDDIRKVTNINDFNYDEDRC